MSAVYILVNIFDE